ncbi:MAG: sulfatase [Bryobacteraceae bacterium]
MAERHIHSRHIHSRRDLLRTAPLLGAALSGSCSPTAKESRPNILFAIADDQSFPHAGAYGDRLARTPAFDRVAREGMLFTRSYCAAPSCTPSRSAILTGRAIWQVEEGGVLYGTVPPQYPLFTHKLEDAGYHVGFTGKPWAPGNWQAGGLKRHPNGREFNQRKMPTPPPPGIDTRDYAANFDDFLAARAAGQPFFFWFGCTEPHRVYDSGYGRRLGKRIEDVEVPGYWPDSEIVRNDILDYYAEVDWFDSHLARMLAALERADELDNTIVVVTSDNGMPFPRSKVNLYDRGVHMPLAIRWGRRFSGGAGNDSFVSHIDFAPTFLEAAGVRPPETVAGRSLIPLLEGKAEAERDCAFTALERHTMCRPDGATYPIRAIHTARYAYLRNFQPDRWPTGGEFLSSNKTTHGDVDACPTKEFLLAPATRARYQRQWDLCFGRRPAEELYDLQSDPAQLINLSSDPAHAATKIELWQRLQTHLRATGDPRIEGRDPWQSYVYHQTIGYGATFNRSLPQQERDRAAGRGSHKPE